MERNEAMVKMRNELDNQLSLIDASAHKIKHLACALLSDYGFDSKEITDIELQYIKLNKEEIYWFLSMIIDYSMTIMKDGDAACKIIGTD